MSAATLDPFRASAGDPWDSRKAAHLLRRAGFGARSSEIEEIVKLGPEKAVARLVADAAKPEPDADERSSLSLGESLSHGGDIAPLRGAWLLRMQRTRRPLRERMTLFWHGHFATGNSKVGSPRLLWIQQLTLARLALAPFPELLAAVTRDPAMLVYLDGAQNRRGQPNENYARELFELFALGIGNYTEKDIQETARALTGFVLRDGKGEFESMRHDAGPKSIFGRTGAFGPDEVLSLVLEQQAASGFIARKIARLLLADEPDAGVVAELARGFRASGFDSSALVSRILRSSLFYSDRGCGTRILGPIEHVVGTVRSLGLERMPPSDVARAAEEMGQLVFDPPNVKGWDGGRAWINSATWLRRLSFADEAARAFDPDRFAKESRLDPVDENGVSDAILALRLDTRPTSELREAVRGAARQGGGDRGSRLRAAARFILSLPEAQVG